MSVDKTVTAEDREMLVIKDMLKLAEVSNRVIEATQADNASADSLVPEVVNLAKSAGLIASSSEEANLREMLVSRTGVTKVACQLLRDIAAQQKQAATTTAAPQGFAVVGGGNGRPVSKQASHGADEEDVISKFASAML